MEKFWNRKRNFSKIKWIKHKFKWKQKKQRSFFLRNPNKRATNNTRSKWRILKIRTSSRRLNPKNSDKRSQDNLREQKTS